MDNDKGLIGFLQKKSLFNSEAQKNARKKRSNTINSNDKDSIIKTITERDLRSSMSKEKNEPANYNLKNSHTSNEQIYIKADKNQNQYIATSHVKSRFGQQGSHIPKELNKSIEGLYKTKQQSLNNNGKRVFHTSQTPQSTKSNQQTPVAPKTTNSFLNTLNKSREQREVITTSSKEKPIKFWQGVINRTNGFQSARSESAQCLQTLSFKIKLQLSNLNNKIDKFRKDLFQYLHTQINSLREKVLSLVEQTFEQSSKYITEYMKIEQKRVAGDLLRIRQDLESYFLKIENMKEEINKPQWRKVAGEILSTELESNIQSLIQQSNSKEVYTWQKRSIGRQKIKAIANELKDLLRLKE